MDVKEKILEKAKEEFLNIGIRNMSVQNLVVPLGISTKTFYKYFKNKEELLEEVVTNHYSEQFTIIRESKEQNPVQLLLNIWTHAFHIDTDVNNKFYFDLHYYYPELEKRVEEKVGGIFWMEFLHLIQKGIDDGLFMENILPDVVMESIAILYGSAVRTDQFHKFHITADQSFLNTVALIIRGICSSRGLIVYEQYVALNFQDK